MSLPVPHLPLQGVANLYLECWAPTQFLTIPSLCFLPFLNLPTLWHWTIMQLVGTILKLINLYFLKKWNCCGLTHYIEVNITQQKASYDGRNWVLSEKLLLQVTTWKRGTEMVDNIREHRSIYVVCVWLETSFWISVLWIRCRYKDTTILSMELRGEVVCFPNGVNMACSTSEIANLRTQNWQKYAKLFQ